ncbi:Dolichyl-diphosphooligosaccharide--protein glycosyltransferase 48 kDa subunit [Ananas comosus]|uniref:Dolichyl-diphosphooligosaccharide--protein glycosyltransferase 48 kDa subunit n=1 Tax=Ananas comosus TaxID=4615 RepID=A0A199VIQ7_ANACO|nr:Dolichyl-diphosphooligosaccharide--protein glycosyltransferase 48 kDa subunit [Ananas comosus]
MARLGALFLAVIAVLPLICSCFSADSPTDRRVLVLVDDLALRSSHSLFFNSLQSRGFDLDFKLADDPKLSLQRYGHYAVSETEGDHTLIASDALIHSDVILGDKKIEAPILFRGTGHSVNPANSLVLKVLSASPSAYSANPKTKLSSPPSLTGSAISLVSIMQVTHCFVYFWTPKVQNVYMIF